MAENTGFDIGGIAAVFYNLIAKKSPQPLADCARHSALHRYHYLALSTPLVVFLALFFFPWNPIYPSILAMFAGAWATIQCRPDLKNKTWIGCVLFLIYYATFLAGLTWSAPGYIDRIWNMDVLSIITVGFMPIEELLFAIGFGMFCSSVYEHFSWRKLQNSTGPNA